MADENPVPKPARPDNGMPFTRNAPTAEEIANEMKRREERKQEIANIMAEMEKKRAGLGTKEEVAVPQSVYGNKIPNIEATAKHTRGFGGRIKSALKAELERVKKGPLNYKSIAQMREETRGSKHPALGFAKKLVVSGLRSGGQAFYRGLENTGQELIAPTEESPISSTWYQDPRGNWYRKDIRSISSKLPLGTRRIETWQRVVQVTDPRSNQEIGTKEIWHPVSIATKHLDVNERAVLRGNMQDILNGEDLVSEISSKRRGLVALTRPTGSINMGATFGAGGYPLRGNLRTATPSFKMIKLRKTTAAPTRGGKVTKTIQTTTSAPSPNIQIKRVTVKPPIETQSVGATIEATRRNAAAIVPPGYIPEHAYSGLSYGAQVERWIGRPKVIGFLTTPERPLAADLLGIQEYARRLDYTGRPTLTRDAAYTLAGIKHSVGPAHDLSNQIFDPRYAMAKMGGGARPTIMSYQGRPTRITTVSARAFKPTVSQRALMPQFTNLQDIRQITSNIRWF